MNDGRIVAADIQYYANAGHTVDESLLVGKSGSICYLISCVSYKRRRHILTRTKNRAVGDFILAGGRKDSASHRQRLQHPQPAGP